jgi:hypothetical protein
LYLYRKTWQLLPSYHAQIKLFILKHIPEFFRKQFVKRTIMEIDGWHPIWFKRIGICRRAARHGHRSMTPSELWKFFLSFFDSTSASIRQRRLTFFLSI